MIMERLGLKADHTVIDLGCGTGAFALSAAHRCRRVFAVDISPAMLEVCSSQARAQGLTNLEIASGGFLTYEHADEPVDVLVSNLALHHLPDFWKAIALHRINGMLIPEGRLYLFDVIFAFPVSTYGEELEKWLETMAASGGEKMREESMIHISDEYSTFEWIMDGLLQRTGFQIEKKYREIPGCLAYLCRKQII